MSDPTRININFDPTARRMVGIARHGATPFDVPIISRISDHLWQGGCESGLVLPSFIKHLISLYPWEKYTVHHNLSSELIVRMYDSEDQQFHQIDAIARWAVNCCEAGQDTLIHCQAGLNRSSLVAARVLMLQGSTGQEAIQTLRDKRSPACLCNRSFEKHLLSIKPNENQ